MIPLWMVNCVRVNVIKRVKQGREHELTVNVTRTEYDTMTGFCNQVDEPWNSVMSDHLITRSPEEQPSGPRTTYTIELARQIPDHAIYYTRTKYSYFVSQNVQPSPLPTPTATPPHKTATSLQTQLKIPINPYSCQEESKSLTSVCIFIIQYHC